MKECIKGDCMMWLNVTLKDGGDGSTCSIPFHAIQSTYTEKAVRSVQAAVESHRNESITRQDMAMERLKLRASR